MPLFFFVNATRSKKYNSPHALRPITYSRHAAREQFNYFFFLSSFFSHKWEKKYNFICLKEYCSKIVNKCKLYCSAYFYKTHIKWKWVISVGIFFLFSSWKKIKSCTNSERLNVSSRQMVFLLNHIAMSEIDMQNLFYSESQRNTKSKHFISFMHPEEVMRYVMFFICPLNFPLLQCVVFV